MKDFTTTELVAGLAARAAEITSDKLIRNQIQNVRNQAFSTFKIINPDGAGAFVLDCEKKALLAHQSGGFQGRLDFYKQTLAELQAMPANQAQPTSTAVTPRVIYSAPPVAGQVTAFTSPSKPTFGQQPGEPNAEALTVLREELFGRNYSSNDYLCPNWNGSSPSITALNYENCRDEFYRQHVAVEGLSFAPCIARKTTRANYPVTDGQVSTINNAEAFARGFLAVCNQVDTTGKEYTAHACEDGVRAGQRFIALKERLKRQSAEQVAAARSNLAKAQQSVTVALTEAEKATLKHYGVMS